MLLFYILTVQFNFRLDNISQLQNYSLMILQQDHRHQVQDVLVQKPKSENQIVLQKLFNQSKSFIHDGTANEIERMRIYLDDKVYLSYCDNERRYLQHMCHKSQNQNRNRVLQLMMSRESKVNNQIIKAVLDVQPNMEKQKMKKIREFLQSKVLSVKQEMKNFSLSPQKKKQLQDQHLEFRRKGYWKQKSEKNEQVKKFINHMQQDRKKLDQKYQKSKQYQSQKLQARQQRQKSVKQEEIKRIRLEIQQKRQRAKSQRRKYEEQNKQRQQEHKIFVKKLKRKPIYITNQQKFIKQVLEPAEEERKKKLEELKKERKPIDIEGIELHQQWYEQMREKALDTDQKKQQFRQLIEKNSQKLKELYHGRFHQNFEEEINKFEVELEEKKKKRQKISSYSQNVKEAFRPMPSPSKKREFKKMIQQLKDEENRGKKKIVQPDGQVRYEQISFQKQRQIGVSYLDELKAYNENRKRKNPEDRSSSMMQLTKKPVYPNYLQELRPKDRVDTSKSRTNWKKILKNDNYTKRDKYNSVIEHVEILDSQARQKELQLKYSKDKNNAKTVDLKKEIDKRYLDSLSAKMNALKEVIIKQ